MVEFEWLIGLETLVCVSSRAGCFAAEMPLRAGVDDVFEQHCQTPLPTTIGIPELCGASHGLMR